MQCSSNLRERNKTNGQLRDIRWPGGLWLLLLYRGTGTATAAAAGAIGTGVAAAAAAAAAALRCSHVGASAADIAGNAGGAVGGRAQR